MMGVIGDDGDQDCTSRVNKVRRNHPGVEALLKTVKDRGNQLSYMVIYLSPGDYHRFHSPAIHTARFRRHIAGYLSPVKPSYVKNHRDVFKNNERVNIFGDWFGTDRLFFFLSYVGALNVGSIKLDFDNDVLTNQVMPKDPYLFDKAYVKDQKGPLANFVSGKPNDNYIGELQFRKGEMTDRFEMGSTIVLIWESAPQTHVHVIEGQKVKLGQKLVTIKK